MRYDKKGRRVVTLKYLSDQMYKNKGYAAFFPEGYKPSKKEVYEVLQAVVHALFESVILEQRFHYLPELGTLSLHFNMRGRRPYECPWLEERPREQQSKYHYRLPGRVVSLTVKLFGRWRFRNRKYSFRPGYKSKKLIRQLFHECDTDFSKYLKVPLYGDGTC